MDQIIKETIITRKEEIAFADMDGEIVMMNLEKGNYYNLGKTGSVVWNMLEKPISVETLIQDLLEKYYVTRQQCEEEVLFFLNELKKEGLIIIR